MVRTYVMVEYTKEYTRGIGVKHYWSRGVESAARTLLTRTVGSIACCILYTCIYVHIMMCICVYNNVCLDSFISRQGKSGG